MARGAPLLDAPDLRGRAFIGSHSAAADAWFAELFAGAAPDTDGAALIAVGGYGRCELFPHSDLDLLLLHRKRSDIADVAERLWYPAWDRGLKLGHGVFTVPELIRLATTELDQATALLDARLVAGDITLLDQLTEDVDKLWAKRAGVLLAELGRRVDERHRRVGDVAFKIEPELKEGRGGLRDLHALAWAERAEPGFASDFLADLDGEAETLVEARVELHRSNGRPGDTLTLDDQDDVAAALGDPDGQELMLRLALAARRIAWHSDEAWERWQWSQSRPRRGRPRQILTDQLELVDGQVEVRAGVDVESDPLLLLRIAEYAARTSTKIGRNSLERLRDETRPVPDPWPAEARDLFARLFFAGKPAIDVVEDLDQFHLMTVLLPEWEAVRCRPQRNVLHTYTVDRHLCEAAANAADLVDDVSRPDLLIVGTLLHDIGKGFPGDHTEVGIEVIDAIATRMGYAPDDVAVLVDLCRHHLLLPDVATRRDIADPGTARAVAAAVDSVDFLYLLAALTQADSIATGPSTWGSWKAGMLQDLVARTADVLEGGGGGQVGGLGEFPPADLVGIMSAGVRHVVGERATLTVVAPDVPGLFGRIAGVLAMSGLEVLEAAAYSDDDGMAASQFVVQESASHPPDWAKVERLAEQALDGRLALSARVSARAENYRRMRRRLAADPARRLVNIDNSISDVATVVDVHAPDTIGLLFRITRALGELHLDIRRARVQTLGPEAVDSFYLCDQHGSKLDDPELLAELELAIHEAMGDEE